MRTPPADRFWRYVIPTEGCWEWLGPRHKSGYGSLSWRQAGGYAHRAAWMLIKGPIPAGMWILHRCDNPPCVNPHHLFLGTPADNAHDSQAKGRRLVAVQRPPRRWTYSRLTPDQVRDIRRRYRSGERIADIARVIDRSWITVWNVTTRRVYADILDIAG